MASLSQKTITGVVWNLAEQFAVRGISVFVTLLLAYFLSPEDFGLVAMMTVFISIATSLMDSGFRQALIRLPDAKQVDFNTAFYANILLGLVAYLLLFLAAPLISGFYDEARLTTLIRVAGLVVIINAFQVVQYSCLSRALNFKIQFRAAFPASLISAFVAITMAYSGYGVWALITQMLVSALMVATFLWLQNMWRPTCSWSMDSLKSMYLFGYKLFLADLLDIVFRNIFVVVIAKLFSVSLAGIYFFADKIREFLVLRIVVAIQNVTYPALTTLQGNDEQLRSGYRNLVSVNTYVLSPLIFFSAALSELFFEAFLPEKWMQASSYLALMCIAGALTPVSALNLNILKVKGRSDLSLKVEVIKKIIQVSVLIVSVEYGVIGILYGQIFSSIIVYIINSHYSEQLIDYSVFEQTMDFMPNILIAAGIGVIIYIAQDYFFVDPTIRFFIFGFIAVFAYVLVSYLVKPKGYLLLTNLMKKFFLRYDSVVEK